MGLAKSIKRRIFLVKGETFSTAVKVFFASKQKRREFELKKFGYLLTYKSSRVSKTGLKTEENTIKSFLDEDWYASIHQLASPKDAFDHYIKHGRNHAYAPNKEISDGDGKNLSHWGVELLVKCGVRVGDPGEDNLSPENPSLIDPLKIKNPNGKKVAVVTAIFGGHDTLMPFNPLWRDNSDFYVFSDRIFENSEHWQQIHAPYHHVDPRRKARFIKLKLPTFFQEYEWVIWVDGNILICEDPASIVSGISAETYDFSTFLHVSRNSILSEAAACVERHKISGIEASSHLSKVSKHEGFRSKILFETMAMVLRPSSSSVQSLFAAWWRLLSNGSKRDQLSLPLAIAETPDLQFAPLHLTIDQSHEFFRTKHNAKMEQS